MGTALSHAPRPCTINWGLANFERLTPSNPDEVGHTLGYAVAIVFFETAPVVRGESVAPRTPHTALFSNPLPDAEAPNTGNDANGIACPGRHAKACAGRRFFAASPPRCRQSEKQEPNPPAAILHQGAGSSAGLRERPAAFLISPWRRRPVERLCVLSRSQERGTVY